MSLRPLLRAAYAATLSLALPAAGAAQQNEVRHERLTFVGTELTIHLLTDAPGSLRLIHGQPGQIEVTARAPGGVAGFGLAGEDRGRLELTAAGAQQVDYVVVVPSDARVHIRLPGDLAAKPFGTLQRTAIYRWPKGGE
jgi:hypothetical protein